MVACTSPSSWHPGMGFVYHALHPSRFASRGARPGLLPGHRRLRCVWGTSSTYQASRYPTSRPHHWRRVYPCGQSPRRQRRAALIAPTCPMPPPITATLGGQRLDGFSVDHKMHSCFYTFKVVPAEDYRRPQRQRRRHPHNHAMPKRVVSRFPASRWRSTCTPAQKTGLNLPDDGPYGGS